MRPTMRYPGYIELLVCVLLGVAAQGAIGEDDPAGASCLDIHDDAERLACFDHEVGARRAR